MSTPQTAGQGMSAAAIEQIRQKLGLNLSTLLTATKAAATYQPLSTTLSSAVLPTSPRDGDRATYLAQTGTTNADTNALWQFTYNAADAAWYLQSGAPLTKFAAVSDSTASLVYVAPGTATEIILPFAGDYLVAISAQMNNSTSGDGALASYAAGSTVADDQWSVGTFGSSTSSYNGIAGRPFRLHSTLLAGDKIALRIRAHTGGTAIFNNRLLNVLPLRVH